MASFGELVLVAGDLHSPARVSNIAPAFAKILVPGRMRHGIFTGNFCSAQDLCANLVTHRHDVSGKHDVQPPTCLPQSRTVEIGGFRIGIINGYQIVPTNDIQRLADVARALDVDLLCHGSSGQPSTAEAEGRCLVCPGSVTGSTGDTPSFIVMSITHERVEFYIYRLVDGQLSISKTHFAKQDRTAVRSAAPGGSTTTSMAPRPRQQIPTGQPTQLAATGPAQATASAAKPPPAAAAAARESRTMDL